MGYGVIKMNTFTAKYDTTDYPEIQRSLALPFAIEEIEIEIQYEISPYRPATFYDPAEGGELEDVEYNILTIGNFVPTDKQVKIIFDIIDTKEFKEIITEWILNDYADKKNQEKQDYAEYRYDILNDR